jgi:mono/diheme cytochrome c family protein
MPSTQRFDGERFHWTRVLVTLSLFCVFGGGPTTAADSAEGKKQPPRGLIEAPVKPSGYVPASFFNDTATTEIYTRRCAACHGEDGDGQGEAAYLLYPKPRDFTRGEYRLVSTWDGVPTDQDLFQTLSRGMPGSAMPSWAHLSEETRWSLVHYVKTFSAHDLSFGADREPSGPGEMGGGVITLPPRPPSTPDLRARGRELFLVGCASCHGATAKGDGQQKQQDSRGYPTQPRDLTAGVYKGLPEPDELYRRIVLGLPGSPMPASPYLHGRDGWALVDYVLSLSSPRQREKVEMKRFRIVARRTDRLPQHADDGDWNEVPPVELHLMPLWWRPGRPEVLTVRALHDGNDLALLLQWADETDDHTAIRPQDFRDAAAVELSATPDPPFFGMGATGEEVSIWMWKSERQADLQAAFQDMEEIYPNLGIDSYPNLELSPLEQPARHAMTLDSDKAFITAWGAGNIVSDPTRGSAVENLESQGFGTLRARPPIDQTVRAMGSYGFGSYQVVFQRAMNDEAADARILEPGRTIPIGFAVWDGSAGDRDGKKSVTIWQELYIEP